MKKIFLPLCLMVASSSFAAASGAAFFTDTALQRSCYKRSRQQFIEMYGQDPHARALINFYFRRKNPGIRTAAIGVPLTVIPFIALNTVNQWPDETFGDGIAKGIAESYIALFISAGITALLIGSCVWLRYSRSRLYQLLKDYASGQPLPKGITRNKMYRAFLHYGEWNRSTRSQIKRMKYQLRKAKHRSSLTDLAGDFRCTRSFCAQPVNN